MQGMKMQIQPPEAGPSAAGSRPLSAVGTTVEFGEGGFAGVTLLMLEDEVFEFMPFVADFGSTLVAFETSPCASMASRAAFSLALLALSNTSTCTRPMD